MDQDNKIWEEFKTTQNDFYLKKGQLLGKNNIITIVREAFKDPNDNIAVLRLLQTFVYNEIEIIKQVMPELVDGSLTGNPTTIYFSRKVISLIDRNWLASQLEHFVKSIPVNEEEWVYRRTAELYTYLNLSELLSRHLDFCKSHQSEEIREIADDFSSPSVENLPG